MELDSRAGPQHFQASPTLGIDSLQKDLGYKLISRFLRHLDAALLEIPEYTKTDGFSNTFPAQRWVLESSLNRMSMQGSVLKCRHEQLKTYPSPLCRNGCLRKLGRRPALGSPR